METTKVIPDSSEKCHETGYVHIQCFNKKWTRCKIS